MLPMVCLRGRLTAYVDGLHLSILTTGSRGGVAAAPVLRREGVCFVEKVDIMAVYFETENILRLLRIAYTELTTAILTNARSTFAFDTARRRHPIILTNVIDYVSRLQSSCVSLQQKVCQDQSASPASN